MGIMVMDSTPPATTISAPPAMMRSAAMAIACRPEEQKRLMVMAEISTGRPARSEAMRATFMPCSASGMAQPRMTSSISLGSSLRHALERALDGHGGQIVGTGGAQGSFVGFADRGANGTDDYDFTHEKLQQLAISN